MKKEEKYINKSLYKIELVLIKAIPYLISVLYMLNSILSYFGIDTNIISHIGGLSLLVFIFLYVSSFAFKFCIYHRLPLYYILICDIINYYDYYIGIPINNKELLILHLILIAMFVLLLVYFKFKSHESRSK